MPAAVQDLDTLGSLTHLKQLGALPGIVDIVRAPRMDGRNLDDVPYVLGLEELHRSLAELVPITRQGTTQENGASNPEASYLLRIADKESCCKRRSQGEAHDGIKRTVVTHIVSEIIHGLGDTSGRSVKVGVANLLISERFADPIGCGPWIFAIQKIKVKIISQLMS
ncbi:MAG: hypothetical protein L6R42_001797 [Xanthoria sp. 1 TBL-2021]|nr:MAG: hypothetical protein L6R42_001797 [Xanthoria sp. 1 TBL-2021]